MSIYGHFNHQYYGNKIKFPKESFLIAGISHYQDNLVNISCNSELKLKTSTGIHDVKICDLPFHDKEKNIPIS